MITNIRWVVTRTNYILGTTRKLPSYIRKKRSIITLDTRSNDGAIIEDNLCAFRCLAYHKLKNRRGLERETIRLFREYFGERLSKRTKFRGLCLDDIPKFENTFDINVNIFQLFEDDSCVNIYRSRGKNMETMNLNLYEEHLSYISHMNVYSKKYECRNCKTLFPTHVRVMRHEKRCKEATRYIFPGGYYARPQHIFEELEYLDIKVEDDLRFYPYFITYDFESLLLTNDLPNNTQKLSWTHEHHPVSFSMCSNVPNHLEPVFEIDVNVENLLKKFVKRATEIQITAQRYMKARFCNVFKKLLLETKKLQELSEEILDEEEEDTDNDDDEEENDRQRAVNTALLNHIKRIQEKLETYVNEIPVLGYNSSKYDLNLIKSKLAECLDLVNSKKNFIVKKCNQYMCISNGKFKFLDISNFVAPGFSYDKFIKSYEIELHKSYFPYEFCSNYNKLEYTELPPYEAFFSSLKNCNVLEEEFFRYRQLVEDEKVPVSMALKTMNLKEKPRTGQENYQHLLKIWQDQGMRNMIDYLKYYNNLDVLPFCQAVSKMLRFYMTRNIDLFKTCISVPGVARELVFRSSADNAHFACFDKQNKDLYEVFRKGMCGGPAIIFNRYHERDTTFIRQNKNKLCKKIVGYDANALYLWALKQQMPTGPFTIRKELNGFRLMKRDRYLKAFYYLEWLRYDKGVDIDHYFNKGKEFRIGPYLVDGFSRNEKKVYEFNGCYFHHHDCALTRHITDPKWLKEKKN